MFALSLSLSIDRYKILQALAVSSCFVLLLCFFTPLDIFFSNTREFSYIFNEIVLYLVLVSLSLIPVLTLILILIPKSIFERVVSVFLVIIISLWAQGTILYRDYGPLDGGKINWDRWATAGYVEAGICSIAILLVIIFSSFFKRIVNLACVVILLALISTFAIEYFQYSRLDQREVIFDESVKFDFSSERNVILILLDEVQSDVFQEIISEHPEFREQFGGFVYYPDTIAGYSFTLTSVPNILTGTYYDNSAPFDRYIEKSYLGNSIPRVLKERGYKVDLIPTFYDTTVSKSPAVASNLIRKGQIANFQQGLSEGLHLIDIAIFRSVPHLLKRYVINDNQWLLSQLVSTDDSKLSHLSWWSGDRGFYDDISEINDSVREPVFKFFHLHGCHAPYTRNEIGEPVADAATRETYKNFLIYNLRRLVSFLNELKSKGLYDRSLIYIFGDHGAGRYEELKINTELVKHNGYIDTTIPTKIKARAITLFMVKGFSSTGGLQVSGRPMSLAKIPQMLFDDLNIELDKRRRESFSKVSDSDRSRKYLYWQHPYVDPMYEYTIEGNGWLDSSWTGPTRVYTKRGSYDKDFSVIFDHSDSTDYRIESSQPHADYEFGPSGKNGYSITVNKANRRSNYFLGLVLDENTDLDDVEIGVYADEKLIRNMRVNQTTPFAGPPIIGIPIPARYSSRGKLNIDISYARKSSSNIDRPFRAIKLFKLERS